MAPPTFRSGPVRAPCSLARCCAVGVRGVCGVVGMELSVSGGDRRSAKRCKAARLVIHLEPRRTASSFTVWPAVLCEQRKIQRKRVERCVFLPRRAGGTSLQESASGMSVSVVVSIMVILAFA